MSDEARGYREGPKHAAAIAPDRRRSRSAMLVGGGMIAGAAVLLLAQRLTPSASSNAKRAPVIHVFAAAAESEDVTSPRGGPVVSDGKPDQLFVLDVDGPLAGVVVVQCDSRGVPISGGLRWGTIDFDPASPERASYGPPGSGSWQLAVTEENRRLNDPLGAIAPLDASTHHLLLHLSPAGAFTSGSYARAWVVGRDHTVAQSSLVHVSGDPRPAVTAPPPQPGGPQPFNKGAALSAIGSVRLDRCSKLRGMATAGRVEVTFAPDGSATDARVVEGVLENEAGRCVLDEIKRHARVPAFAGAPARVMHIVTVPPSRTYD